MSSGIVTEAGIYIFCKVTDSLVFNDFSDVNKVILLYKVYFSSFLSFFIFSLNKVKYKDQVNVGADVRCQTDSLRK